MISIITIVRNHVVTKINDGVSKHCFTITRMALAKFPEIQSRNKVCLAIR